MHQLLTTFALLLIFANPLFSQRYRVTYESYANNNTRLELSKQLSGNDADLLIALHYIHKGSELLYDNGVSSWFFNGKDTYPNDCSINEIKFKINTSIVYKNHSENETTYMNKLYEGVCKTHEIQLAHQFEITGETKMVNGYLTQRAVLKSNRVVDAWFTPQIPIQDGPFNIGGLPGLVLEFNDKDITYRMLKVEEISEGVEIILPLPKCKEKLNPEDYNKHRRNSRGG
jgi:GLPGLI family protein